MRYRTAIAVSVMLLAGTLVAGCSTALISSWKAPDAVPFPLDGEKVAAIVMSTDPSIRRAGEDALARRLTQRGARGIPMYTLLGDAAPDEAAARSAAERAGVVGVVVIRPVRVEKAVAATTNTYTGPAYDGFWGGYFGHGWASAWPTSPDHRTVTIVTVETLVYALPSNTLVWAGRSTTADPRTLDRLIDDTARQVSAELARLRLMPKA